MSEKKHKPVLVVTTLLLIIILATYSIYVTVMLQAERRPIRYDADTIAEIDALKTGDQPLIVVLGADYCPTCVNYDPYVRELSKQYGDRITIRIVDTVQHEAIREKYNIELIPTTLFFDKSGGIYKPTAAIEIEESEKFDGEPKYVSNTITPIDGRNYGLHPSFEYGIGKLGEFSYCKYVGLIDMVTLNGIAEELLLQ